MRLYGWLLLLLWSCTGEVPVPTTEEAVWTLRTPKEAINFKVWQKGACTMLVIEEGWKGATTPFKYLLYPKGTRPPAAHPEAIRVPVPLEHVLSSGSVDVAFMAALEATDRIVGMSGGAYVYDSTIQTRLQTGEIADLGQHQALNYERAVSLQPDAAFIYSIGDQSIYQKYQELGIPAILLSDFMEETPLGRAEWVVFMGYLLGKSEEAYAYYNKIATHYRTLQQQAKLQSYQPTVFTGAVYKGTWYIAGGKSFMAQLIRDAGGKYLWENNTEVSGVPLDFEAVYAKALEADIWINQSHFQTQNDLLAAEDRYKDFKAVQNSQLYNYYKRANAQGGSDIFESAIVRPDRVLEDLMHLFQVPVKGLDETTLYYYAPL